MLTFKIPTGVSHGVPGNAVRAALVAGCALFVCACNTDQQVAAAVNDGLGNYNRANWTERQRMLAKFVLLSPQRNWSTNWPKACEPRTSERL